MRKISLVLMGTFCSSVIAQELLECINPDVLAGLVFSTAYDDQTVFSAAMPLQMSDVATPPEFVWVGSAERPSASGLTTTAAYRTDLSARGSVYAAIAGLSESGWEPEELDLGLDGNASGQTPATQTACRDEAPVSVSANEINGTTYVTYSFASRLMTAQCIERVPFASSLWIAQQLPVWAYPPDPVTGVPVRPSGTGSGGSELEYDIRARFRHSGSLSETASFFEQQLPEQGWVHDVSWTGASQSSSAWSRISDDNTRLQGTLDVTALTGGRYNLMFRVVMLQ